MLAHIVFSTKNRADLIALEIENELFGYIHGIIENNKAGKSAESQEAGSAAAGLK